MKTNCIKVDHTLRQGGMIVQLHARLNDECGNGFEDFAITYELYEGHISDRTMVGGGRADYTDDKYVRAAIRTFGLEPVERVHLCDMNGLPMHPLANALYWAKERQFETFKNYLRLTDDEAKVAYYIDSELGLYTWLSDKGIFRRWKREADEAIKAIIGDRDFEFESTARKPQGHLYFSNGVEPTAGAIQSELDLIREGYYAPEKSEQRLRDRKVYELQKTFARDEEYWQKKIDEMERDRAVKREIMRVLVEHFDEFERPFEVYGNVIFYTHKNELAFNWRGTFMSELVSDNDFRTISKYLYGYCKDNNITITNNKKG